MVSLVSKYQPRKIADFVGIAEPKAALAAVARQPYASAWLLLGDPGTGKTTINRCHNPNAEDRKYYSDLGVKVCDEWRYDYPAFLAYVGRRPGKGYSLDRWPNNDGNYEPGNVRWATQKEQCRNWRRRIAWINYGGLQRRLIEVCEEIGFPYHKAISRHGRKWPDEDLFLPITHHRKVARFES